MGILFCLLAAISFGLLGTVSKLAERGRANPSGVVIGLFAWAVPAMLIRTVVWGPGLRLPASAAWVAVGCGICAAVAYFAFQASIRIGKVTAGWLMMNLSAGVPAILSVWIYNERVTPLRVCALVLALVSVVCLFCGHRGDEASGKREAGI